MNLSIIIPFYGQLNYLNELLHNLQEVFLPHAGKFSSEVIVVNDSPWIQQNQIEAAVASFAQIQAALNVRVIHHTENTGVAQARITGIAAAKGSWLYLLDQDDLVQDCLANIILDNIHSRADFILCNGIMQHEENKVAYPIYFWKPRLTLKSLILDDFIRSPGQVLFKKELLSKAPYPIPKEEKGCDDRYLWIVLFLFNEGIHAVYDSRKAYVARIHAGNFGKDSQRLYRCSLSLWEQLSIYPLQQYQNLAAQNILALKYACKQDRSLNATLAYIRYKFRWMKMFRFLVKRILFIQAKLFRK